MRNLYQYIKFAIVLFKTVKFTDMIMGIIGFAMVWFVYAGSYVAIKLFGDRGLKAWGGITFFIFQVLMKKDPSNDKSKGSSKEVEKEDQLK